MGIHIAPNGYQKEQAQAIRKKSNEHARAISAFPINRSQAGILYRSSYVPSMKYPLPATMLTDKQCARIQRKTDSVYLAKQWYNSKFPRAVADAVENIGGLGIQKLHTEQGICQVETYVKHVRSRTTLEKVLRILTEQYQLISGLSRSILRDTRPLPHAQYTWLSSLCKFLHSTSAEVLLEDEWVVATKWKNNQHLMDISMKDWSE